MQHKPTRKASATILYHKQLRDEIAKMALESMLFDNIPLEHEQETLRRENYEEFVQGYCKSAYVFADEFLKARKS